ncbi:MAG: tyrosine-protein phosphatase [Bacteroidales bacterium]|jgi:protein-tyrosine phosphatase
MSIFGNIFTSKKLSQPINLASIGIDMHSHLIPGIDDGVATLNQSIALIREMHDLGFSKIITTPHIQGEVYKNTPEIILAGLEDVRKAIKTEGINVQLEAAAEYLLDDGFAEKFQSKNLLTFGSKYILVEMSYFSPHPNLFNFIFDLQIDGYKVILAHPERYSYWFNSFNKYEELKDRSVFFQLNTISLGGYYGEMVKKVAEKLVDANMIDFLGTDMHNTNYLNGLKETQFEKYLDKILSSGKIMNSIL